MATLNFYLDRADKQGKSFIMMTYLAGGQKFRHSVKLKIFPGKWLANKQRLKENSTDDKFINGHLDSLENIIKEAQTHSLLSTNEINFSYVRQKFNDALGKKETKRTLQECFENYIAHSRANNRFKTTERIICTFNHLKEFRKLKRYELTFDRINQSFYETFMNYLLVDKGILNNSANTYVKTIKAFIAFSVMKGFCSANNDIKNFKVFKDDSALIYLSEEELLSIFHLKLESPELIVVRENFCFACFTGLRYSDIVKLQKENIKTDYIEITTEKTRDFLKIPLNVYAKGLLKRNNGSLPKLFSNVLTNFYLKEIGKLAEINEQTQIIKYRGVEKVEFIEPKYKFLGTHTARRTFVTLSLEKGMRPETVMSITGHKDYQTFKKYIKLSDKVKIVEMNNIWSKSLYIA
ncbi:MAG TPA: site-specific integrase [Mucilaginibacter sp.]|nr:site-specific integrase [Mucilaginibacter sp.]